MTSLRCPRPASPFALPLLLLCSLPVALRALPVPGFPHILLFYMPLPDAVELIRVIDTARGMEPLAEDIAA